MIKELIKLSNHLDAKGLRREADYLDAVIRKIAETPEEKAEREKRENRESRVCMNYCVKSGDSLASITKTWSGLSATWQENAKLNGWTDEESGPAHNLKPCQKILVFTPVEAMDMTGPNGPSDCAPECPGGRDGVGDFPKLPEDMCTHEAQSPRRQAPPEGAQQNPASDQENW